MFLAKAGGYPHYNLGFEGFQVGHQAPEVLEVGGKQLVLDQDRQVLLWRVGDDIGAQVALLHFAVNQHDGGQTYGVSQFIQIRLLDHPGCELQFLVLPYIRRADFHQFCESRCGNHV